MRILRIVLIVILLIVVILVIGGFVFYNDVTRSPLPQTSGTLTVSGLQAEVEILRDEYGIPHIYASNPHDLFFAQGLVQAQDRWWQMEFARHIGHGRIEELTGKADSVFGTDVFIRTAGWTEAAERDLQALDEATIAALQAFSDGVNAYISSRSPNQLALEYRLLGLTGVNITVEPWTPLDTLVWGKVMSWNLTDTYDRELTRASLLETVGEQMTNDYTPPFPYDDKPTILADEDLPITEESAGGAAINSSSRPVLSNQVAGSITGELAFIGSSSSSANSGIGSNNWVATGEMTESGLPLLANDPHLGIQMPSIWYEIGLHCLPVTESCSYDVRGFAMPATPGVIIGHNADIAWGVTNVGADVQDLYLITVNPDNPLQYEWNGEWRDMTVREETISFGDGEPPVTIQVRETHLGPIINDNRLDPDTGEPMGFNNENPMALRWTGYEPSTLSQSVIMINQASNWSEFREALTYWTVPSQNFVYADLAGNIGYQTPGLIPIRPLGVDGITPTAGANDSIEWQGFIPFENLPRIYNPDRNYIATANQAVVPLEFYDQLQETLGEEANYLMSYDWSYGYRGQRINQLMNELAPLSVDDYRAIHGDNFDINAQEMFPYVISIDYNDDTLNGARDWLAFWDFHANRDNAQTALWNYFAVHLLNNVFTDQLPEDIEPSSHNLFAIAQMMDDPENPWWDDAGTADMVETRDDIIRQSFAEGYAQAVAEMGADREAWRWGNIHGAIFVSNPLGLSGIDLIEDLVNRGPQPAGGGNEIVNATGWNMLDGLSGDFTLGSLPSMRMIVDMANFENSQTIITTGQSGHPFSPHYDDQIVPWSNIEYHPMLFSREMVERSTQSRLLLVPASE